MDKSKWEYKKLGEVASFINGYAFKPADWKVKGLPIIRIQNLTNPKALYNYYDGNHIDNKYLVDNGDLLVSWSATLGAFIWNQGKALLNQHIFKTVFDKSNIDKHYLKYAIISTLNVMASKAHGITMRHITKKEFDNIKIPEPQLSEQQQIVSELDQLNELISLKQQQLKEYDALAQSIFYEMFGDPMVNNKNWKETIISKLYSVTSSKRIFANEYVTEGIPFYRGKEITELSKGEEVSEPLYISEERYKEIKLKYGVPKLGDILLTAVGTIGNLWVVNNNKPFYFKDGNIIWLQSLNKDLNSVYFKFFLTLIMRKMKDSLSNGAAYKALTIQALGKMSILFPPLTLQQSFAERVRAIERQKALVKQSIAEVQTLLDSRMQEYFG